MHRAWLSFLSLVLTALILGAPAPALQARAGAEAGADYYIVVLSDPALASYRGGIPGLAATHPDTLGEARLDGDSPASLAYLDHLDAVQAAALDGISAAIGHPVEVLDHFRYALNGFTVWLTPAEAERVATLPGIQLVERRTVDQLTTDVGPAWSGAEGIWDGSAIDQPEGVLGEGVIIAVVDTGINTDHPSFAAIDEAGYEHLNPHPSGNYIGWCNPASPSHRPDLPCNDKLIGLWSHPTSGNNPEDDNGHGSHTASTVGGNRIAEAPLVGDTITMMRRVSGVAPHANIAAYDACTAAGGCPSTATVAAIEQATADGVDALNYSIGVGQDSPWLNTRGLAFLGAREAGVFVAVSAGNSGPGAGTVGSNAPWVLTVGNNTHNRAFSNTLMDLSGGTGQAPDDIVGRGMTGALPKAKIVYAKGFARKDGSPDDGRCLSMNPSGQAYAAPFEPDTFDGQIVVCDRGRDARVWKGQAVRDGGGAGLVLANLETDGASLSGDAHVIPAVHISFADGELLKAWLETGGDPMGAIDESTVDLAAENGDVMNAGSSRGPTRTTQCCPRPGLEIYRPALLDVLKPDITGPGTDVLAAVSSGGSLAPPEFALLSGTSMSSPHAAGSGALIRAVHPDWTPAMIQSALMTTARTGTVRMQDRTSPAGPFDQGAGHLQIDRAAQAGFVLDETAARYRAADPSKGGDPKTLNIASLHDTACLLDCLWERTLTSTLDEPVTWNAAGEAGGNATVTVEPASFTLAPGGSQTVRISVDLSGSAVGSWVFGQVSFTPEGEAAPEAHFPLAVMPVHAKLPDTTTALAEKATGTHRIPDLRAIEAPILGLDEHGLAKATLRNQPLSQDPSPANPFDNLDGVLVVTMTVPADTVRLVAELVASEAPDLDMLVGRDRGAGQPVAGDVVCNSGGPSWNEYCDIRNPAPGTWWVLVQSFQGSANQPDDISLSYGAVPAAPAGNFVARGPAAVPAGEPFAIDLDYDLPDFQVGDRWYGAVTVHKSPPVDYLLGVIGIDLIAVPEGTLPTATPIPTDTPTATPVPPTPTPPAGLYMPALLLNQENLGEPAW